MTVAGPPRPLLTLAQVAEKLGVSKRTVVRLRDENQLPCVRIRGSLRFDASDVERLIERSRLSPTPNDNQP